jgi:hypothetical protein
MNAAVHTRYGPPDVVRISEIDKPAAKDNEVLVKVHATTVNRTDSGLRAAKPFINRFFTGLRRPRVTVLGNEFAGAVEAVGGGVRSFKVGDRVFGYNGTRFGAHAEYVAMPQDGSLATMPTNLTYEQAAASTEGSHYALSLIRKATIHRAMVGNWCPGWERQPAHLSADLTADHVREVARGGRPDGRLVVRCRSCNAARSAHLARRVLTRIMATDPRAAEPPITHRDDDPGPVAV